MSDGDFDLFFNQIQIIRVALEYKYFSTAFDSLKLMEAQLAKIKRNHLLQ